MTFRMQRISGGLALVLLLLAAAAAAGGCGAKAQATAEADRAGTTRLSSSSAYDRNTDPCAMRLHDLCAPLLLFYGRYQSLPERLDELAQVPGIDVPELVRPVSKQRYIYNPLGPSGPDSGTRVIVYDAAPTHAGRRWGIAVREPTPGQALVAKVVIVPDAKFNPR